jgi:hypothetical protein
MSTSSGFTSSASETVRGSSAMPQIGQLPGAFRTIWGCMGQVYSTGGRSEDRTESAAAAREAS